MNKRQSVAKIGGYTVVRVDSIAYVEPEDAGQIVIAGSHGGASSGRYAAQYPLGVCFLNDACGGKDMAGIASLAMLDALGRCGATYDAMSARIGDSQDAWENGVISHVNVAAARLGFRTGERIEDALHRIFSKN